MAKYTTIESVEQVDKLLSENTYVLLDFWAEWCAPCKSIAPVFDDLASKATIPSGLLFAKVDVDTQVDVAQKYEITAMPTFILLENGKVRQTVKGANPLALTTLVKYASREVKRAKEALGEEVKYEEGEKEADINIDKMPALNNPFSDIKEKAIMFMVLSAVLFAGLFYMNNM